MLDIDEVYSAKFFRNVSVVFALISTILYLTPQCNIITKQTISQLSTVFVINNFHVTVLNGFYGKKVNSLIDNSRND